MTEDPSALASRKREHIAICETDAPSFDKKTTGFERYDFLHYALTEVEPEKIYFSTDFFGKKINFPMLISCMTGGVEEADNINKQLAKAAARLHIPLGLGSLRYALNTTEFDSKLIDIRKTAGSVPLLGNIGAAQLVQEHNNFHRLKRLVRLIDLNVFVVHLNPLQEMLQKNGEIEFKGLKDALAEFVAEIGIPVMVKEVGSGISARVAAELLAMGVQGIDVAGSGGTSWAGVEILRNNDEMGTEFWDWGIPTAQCIKAVKKLKPEYDFMLVGSGGVNTPMDAAKSLALGADLFASARILFQTLQQHGSDGVIALVEEWFSTIRKIMFLTGAQTLDDFNSRVLIKREENL